MKPSFLPEPVKLGLHLCINFVETFTQDQLEQRWETMLNNFILVSEQMGDESTKKLAI